MIELLSPILGALTRFVPFLFNLWHEKGDRDHEYRMTQLQLQIDKARAEQQIDLVHANSAAATAASEMQAWAESMAAQARPSGVPWIDGLSSSVRPVLTYWHCLVLYTIYKWAQASISLHHGADVAATIVTLVTDFDRSLIGSMLGYWFADRSLMKAAK